MNVQEIKDRIITLSSEERSEISAFLWHLRRMSDPEYREQISARLADTDPSHWVTPEEFERRLDRE